MAVFAPKKKKKMIKRKKREAGVLLPSLCGC